MKRTYRNHVLQTGTTDKTIFIYHRQDPDDLIKRVHRRTAPAALRAAKEWVDKRPVLQHTYVVEGIKWFHIDPRGARLPQRVEVKHAVRNLKTDDIVRLVESIYKERIQVVRSAELSDRSS